MPSKRMRPFRSCTASQLGSRGRSSRLGRAVGLVGEPEGVSITLEPRPQHPDEAPIDLSLECWSLRSCAEVMLEATGLQLRVEGTEGVPALSTGG